MIKWLKPHKHLYKYLRTSKHRYHWQCIRCGRKYSERKETFKTRFKTLARLNWFL